MMDDGFKFSFAEPRPQYDANIEADGPSQAQDGPLPGSDIPHDAPVLFSTDEDDDDFQSPHPTTSFTGPELSSSDSLWNQESVVVVKYGSAPTTPTNESDGTLGDSSHESDQKENASELDNSKLNDPEAPDSVPSSNSDSHLESTPSLPSFPPSVPATALSYLSQSYSSFSQLPPSILSLIFSYSDIYILLRCRRVCRSFYQSSCDSETWSSAPIFLFEEQLNQLLSPTPLPLLTILNLEVLSPSSLTRLNSLIFPSLHTLTLCLSSRTASVLDSHIVGLSSLSRLQALRLDGWTENDGSSWERLGAAMPLGLTVLSIKCAATLPSAALVKWSSRLHSLRVLELNQAFQVTDDALFQLAANILSRLRLYAPMNTASLGNLANSDSATKSARYCSLQVLILSGAEYGDDTIAAICSIPLLRVLHIEQANYCTDESVQYLLELRELRSLQLGRNQITERGLNTLTAVEWPYLISLLFTSSIINTSSFVVMETKSKMKSSPNRQNSHYLSIGGSSSSASSYKNRASHHSSSSSSNPTSAAVVDSQLSSDEERVSSLLNLSSQLRYLSVDAFTWWRHDLFASIGHLYNLLHFDCIRMSEQMAFHQLLRLIETLATIRQVDRATRRAFSSNIPISPSSSSHSSSSSSSSSSSFPTLTIWVSNSAFLKFSVADLLKWDTDNIAIHISTLPSDAPIRKRLNTNRYELKRFVELIDLDEIVEIDEDKELQEKLGKGWSCAGFLADHLISGIGVEIQMEQNQIRIKI